jgi:hypothetical protein
MKKIILLTFLVSNIFAFSYHDLCKKLPNKIYDFTAIDKCDGIDMNINDIKSSQASKKYVFLDKRMEVMIIRGSFALQYLPLISQNISIHSNETILYTTKIKGKKAVINIDIPSNSIQLIILLDKKYPELLIINLNERDEQKAKRIAKEILSKF